SSEYCAADLCGPAKIKTRIRQRRRKMAASDLFSMELLSSGRDRWLVPEVGYAYRWSGASEPQDKDAKLWHDPRVLNVSCFSYLTIDAAICHRVCPPPFY